MLEILPLPPNDHYEPLDLLLAGLAIKDPGREQIVDILAEAEGVADSAVDFENAKTTLKSLSIEASKILRNYYGNDPKYIADENRIDHAFNQCISKASNRLVVSKQLVEQRHKVFNVADYRKRA